MFKSVIARPIFVLLALVAATFALPGVASAAQNSAGTNTASQTQAIPTGVFELLVGGSWKHEKKSGYYRAIALAAGKSGAEYAEVWIQWVSVEKTTASILKNVTIKEIAKLNLASLTLAIDVEDSGNIILVVTHYDTGKEETKTYEFRASSPGVYKTLEMSVASEQ